MNEEQKSNQDILESDESLSENFQGIDILAMMRNMIESEENSSSTIEIFDENSHNIHPTFWTKQSQLATCKKCGRTGETIIEKKCGIGSLCCTCCFCLVCLWPCIPFMCCLVQDHHHYCSSCQEIMGIKTFM